MGYGSAIERHYRWIRDRVDCRPSESLRCRVQCYINKKNSIEYILHMFVYVHYVEIVLYCIYVCVFPIYPSMACVLRMSTYILATGHKRSRPFILLTGCFAKAVEIAWTGNAHLPLYFISSFSFSFIFNDCVLQHRHVSARLLTSL